MIVMIKLILTLFFVSFSLNSFAIKSGCNHFLKTYLDNLIEQESIFHTGIMFKTKSGKKYLAISKSHVGHRNIYYKAEQMFGDIEEISWAGEIQIKDNLILNMNETAGILIENDMKKMTANSNIKNIEKELSETADFKNIFSNEKKLISFDEANKHLSPELINFSRWRHSFVNKAMIQAYGFMDLDEAIKEGLQIDKRKAIQQIKESSQSMLSMLDDVKTSKAFTSVPQKDVRKFREYLELLSANGKFTNAVDIDCYHDV